MITAEFPKADLLFNDNGPCMSAADCHEFGFCLTERACMRTASCPQTVLLANGDEPFMSATVCP